MKKKILSFLCVLALIGQPITGLAEEKTDNNITIEASQSFTAESEDSLPQVYSAVDKTVLSYILDNLKNNSLNEVAIGGLTDYDAILAKIQAVYDDVNASQADVDSAVKEAEDFISGLEYSESVKIISGNKFNSKQLNDYFGGMELDENEEHIVGYTISENSPASIRSQDEKNLKLSDGNINAYIETTSADSGNTELIYDFGEDYYILGAELFSGFYYNIDRPLKRNRRNVGKFRIYTSIDGTDYKLVSEAVAKTKPDETETEGILEYTISTKSGFAAVKARYVKVEIEKDNTPAAIEGQQPGSNLYKLGEMVLKGFRIPPARKLLMKALTSCGNVDGAIYEQGSYSAWKTAYDKAEKAWFDTSSSRDDLRSLAKELENAYKALKISDSQYILSGNIKSKDDTAYYPGYTNYYASKATYSYELNALWAEQDQDNRLLGGGVTKTYPAWVYGSWEARSGNIILDMHQNCYFTGAELWTWEKKDTWIKSISVKISSDGVNYTEVGNAEYTISDEIIDWTCFRRKIPFTTAMTGRYLKYELTGGGYQMNPGEIVVMGIPGTTENENIPSPLGSVLYTDENGNLLYSLEGITDIKASGVIENNGKEDITVNVITGCYGENGELLGAEWSSITVGASKTCAYTNSVHVQAMNKNCSVKTFAWAGDKQIPVSQIKNFGTLK